MDRKRVFIFCGLVLSCWYLTASVGTSFALERPVHTAGLTFLVSGFAIVAFGIISARSKNSSHHTGHYEVVPAHYEEANGLEKTAHGASTDRNRLDMTTRVLLAIALSFIACARVAVTWRILKDIECARPSYLPLLPLLFAIYIGSRDLKTCASKILRQPRSLGEVVTQIIHGSSTRFVLPAILVWIVMRSELKATEWPSTAVCTISNGAIALIPRLQLAGLLLDCAALIVVYNLFSERGSNNNDCAPSTTSTAKSAVLVGLVLIFASLLLAFIGLILFLRQPEHRQWFLTTPVHYFHDTLVLCFAIPFMILCFLFTSREYGFIATFFIVTFTFAYVQILSLLSMNTSYGFPPKSVFSFVFHFLLVTLAVFLYVTSDSGMEFNFKPKISMRTGRYQILLLLSALSLMTIAMFNIRSNTPTGSAWEHPITELIVKAKNQHSSWAYQAHQSDSLKSAEKNYRIRYGREPPPGFDQWYGFAVQKGSIVIDDFDNIQEDLAPFSALSPAELRQRTTDIINNNQNLAGIRVKGGKAEAFGEFPGTHGWMADGVIKMMEPFVAQLPDMELAMNLNDESRVVVPYRILQKARPQWEKYDGFDDFGRQKPNPDISEPHDRFTYYPGYNPTFHSHGSISCPPGSPALTKSYWHKQELCTSCAAPHSAGLFVSNWSLSANPCHQPDLADLHGLHISPSAMVGTHALIPIFSQSKATGYADVRIPSPWNYLDKTQYTTSAEFPDPVFSQKENILFWRGTTTEGVSTGWGGWKGMLRQRLVHLANNSTDPATPNHLISLPLGRNTPKFSTVTRHPSTILEKLATKLDIAFVAPITHCGGNDCDIQTAEFSPLPPEQSVPFEQHWRYRYLFDADGAGFSGRFIPFLHSNSAVLKTALFRQWYEGRVTAWHHFIPIDLRLHDLFSVLAYFGGWRNDVGKYFGGKVWEGREREAQDIARQGREWAAKVLRKEDMEVYLFRLLLEWGRLVSDDRMVGDADRGGRTPSSSKPEDTYGLGNANYDPGNATARIHEGGKGGGRGGSWKDYLWD
ncbi:glycosyltransferase family 90 protein [Aaosphaeria arxii CBS 175.79]|uniref:Glycosyltransferase family 90 protein n=1 Tax=Aaosphaeria arxii CBS 175.79 TaxID=1450172 RepID=A0A6A5XJP7_9PLEO|nr:glycosyltransferase family 90 protein [Aaosphaeria arxii CBS 175.79]KAF2012960.1 glycosyltransferase family 90 protein [Aaosphaeria arxii CBS 175.79]